MGFRLHTVARGVLGESLVGAGSGLLNFQVWSSSQYVLLYY